MDPDVLQLPARVPTETETVTRDLLAIRAEIAQLRELERALQSLLRILERLKAEG